MNKLIVNETYYGDAELVTLVMDNFGTHTAGAFYETFEPKKQKGCSTGWNSFTRQNTAAG